MSLFVKVDSIVRVDGKETVVPFIVNMDLVEHIAPIADGSTSIRFQDAAQTPGWREIRVRDHFSQFEQFCVQTVTAEDIERKVSSNKPRKNYNMPVEEAVAKGLVSADAK